MILIIFSIFSIKCYQDPDYFDYEDSGRRHHRRHGHNNLRYYGGGDLAQPQKSKSKPQFGIIKPGTNQPEHFANAFEAGVGVAKSVRGMEGDKGLEEFARGVNSLLQNGPGNFNYNHVINKIKLNSHKNSCEGC